MSRHSVTTTEDPDYDPYASNRQGLPEKLFLLQRKLYRKAKDEAQFRFYALYDRVYRLDVLWAAWNLVAAKAGCPGVDGVSIDHLASTSGRGGIEALIADLHEELRTKRYRPLPVKRTYIPKPQGGERPLGIPAVRDRIVQMAVKLIVEPIFEADFCDGSYGFRPGRNQQDALASAKEAIGRGDRLTVFDADLQRYFDTVPHDILMRCLRKRITDGRVLRLITDWLRAPVVDEREGGPPRRPSSGTPQGGVLSPLLANVYLHWFDKLFQRSDGPATWANARMIRYADDILICARYISARLRQWIQHTLEDRMKLTLHPEKTRIIDLRRSGTRVDFLGFSLERSASRYAGTPPYLRWSPSRKALQRERDALRTLTDRRSRWMAPRSLVQRVNEQLRGWWGYFGYGSCRLAAKDMTFMAAGRIYHSLRRRSQRPYRLPEGQTWYRHIHQELGLIRLVAPIRPTAMR